jgi:hypothetical protein
MRTFLRTLAATAALTAVVLGAGASTALAATDNASSASVARYVYDDDWCFDYGATYDCSVSHGTLSVTVTPDGREMARIHFKLAVTSFAASGAQIGSSRQTSFDRSVFVEGGLSSIFTVEHQRASGPGYDCAYGYKLKIVNYELVTERYTGPGCS